MVENLAWLTQKTEDPKSNKGNHTQNIWLNCEEIKKWQPPISRSTPPFQVYPHFLAKNFVPSQVTHFLEGPTSSLIRGWGSNYVRSHKSYKFFSLNVFWPFILFWILIKLSSLYQIRIILLGYRKCFWFKGKIIDWE